jgi:hypothetical protein
MEAMIDQEMDEEMAETTEEEAIDVRPKKKLRIKINTGITGEQDKYPGNDESEEGHEDSDEKPAAI